MAIIDKIKAKAKADIKHIVLPEGEEIRNVQAAVMIRDQGLAKLTLLGNPAKVKEVAAGADLTGIDIIDPTDSDKAPLYAATLYDLRKAKGMTEEEAVEWVEYNIDRALPYWGEHAPIIMDDLETEMIDEE